MANLDKDSIVHYVKELQKPDGSFMGDKWGEVDTRFSFCAVAILALLDSLEDYPKENLEAAVSFVKSSMNFDGGFGSRPSSESHAGQIYCCLGFLSIVHRYLVLNFFLYVIIYHTRSVVYKKRSKSMSSLKFSFLYSCFLFLRMYFG